MSSKWHFWNLERERKGNYKQNNARGVWENHNFENKDMATDIRVVCK